MLKTGRKPLDYIQRLKSALDRFPLESLELLIEEIRLLRNRKGQLFLCGNGGSAANAIHLANDFLYGVGCMGKGSLRVTALPANPAVLTCLANDVSYESIFSEQLKVLGGEGDFLIIFSGSGNSANVIQALKTAKALGIRTAAVLGYSGGHCKELADIVLHTPVDDMQISEDLQLVIGHIIMQSLV